MDRPHNGNWFQRGIIFRVSILREECSSVQAFIKLLLNIPLAKASSITKARVQVGGATNWCINSRYGSLQGSPKCLPAPESSEREGKNTRFLLSHYHVPEGFSGMSAGKASTFNVRDPGLIPKLGRSIWRRNRLLTPVFLGFPVDSAGKESTCNMGYLVRSLGWEDPLE